MSDKVLPSAKPTANGGGEANPAFQSNKAQPHNATRTFRRPRSRRSRFRERLCPCSCYCCITLLIFLVLLVAAAGFYLAYRPHFPCFSVDSLSLSEFKVTDTAVTTAFNFSLTARNPNDKITFTYDKLTVKILSGDVDIGDGSFHGFSQGVEDVKTLTAVVSSSNNPFPDGTDISLLKSCSKNHNLPIRIQLDTSVRMKTEEIETNKLKIRVICDGIAVAIPTGRRATVGVASSSKCEVHPRLKWTI